MPLYASVTSYPTRAPKASAILDYLILAAIGTGGLICIRDFARAHGMWTYEPRQGRKAATVVCSACAVVTLAFFSLRFAIGHLSQYPSENRLVNRKSQIANG